jgi:hypothetical protein
MSRVAEPENVGADARKCELLALLRREFPDLTEVESKAFEDMTPKRLKAFYRVYENTRDTRGSCHSTQQCGLVQRMREDAGIEEIIASALA